MIIKKFNESLRDKMVGKELNGVQLKIYNFITDIKEKEEDEFNGEDISKIFELIREVKGVSDMELIGVLVDAEYITPSRILYMIQESLYSNNKQDPWHYYEPKDEEVSEDDIDDLLDVLKKLNKK